MYVQFTSCVYGVENVQVSPHFEAFSYVIPEAATNGVHAATREVYARISFWIKLQVALQFY